MNEYKVISGKNQGDFNYKLHEHSLDGWVPYGELILKEKRNNYDHIEGIYFYMVLNRTNHDVVAYKHKQPCCHKGCLNHVAHPCEVCGRIAGEGAVILSKSIVEGWRE